MFNTLSRTTPIHPSLHAIGRHRGHHGFGHRWGGRHGFRGNDGPPPSRKLNSDELQLVLLALLAEQPAHGYELIRMLEDRSGGFYKPSSGMVYPALTYMDEIGQAQSTADGNRKLYSITQTGQTFLADHRAEADAILQALSRIGDRMGEVRDAFAGVNDADPAAEELYAARGALKHALRHAQGSGSDETRRIARILDRATAEILAGPNQSSRT